VVAAEYQEHFGEHAYDDQGNYIGPSVEHSPETDEAWAEYYEQGRQGAEAAAVDSDAAAGANVGVAEPTEAAPADVAPAEAEPAADEGGAETPQP
jgi:small subunit ribosomal protein S1